MVMPMFVSIHCGGKFLRNAYGIYYSKEAINSWMVDDDISISDLKSQIYECTGYDPEKYNLELATRLNSGTPPTYVRMPIVNDAAWRGLFGQLKANETMIMEIYVKRVAIASGVGSSGQNLIGGNFETQPEPHPSMVSCADVKPQPNIPFSPPTTLPPPPTRIPPPVAPLSMPEVSPYPRPAPVVGEEECNFENIDAIPEEDLQTGDEFEGGTWDSDHLEGGDEYGEDSNRPLSGRTDTHPVEPFNDISEFREADIGYFGRRIEYRGELAADQYFKSKEELVKKIYEVHIKGNQEVRMKRSDRERIQVVCKTPGCEYELRGRATGSGQTWVITMQDKAHTCRSESSRTDHAQLTASIIADIIEVTIKKDPCISIQGVANCVRIMHDNVTPKYNRLWRGREIAIARQFGNWEDSYSLLEPLLLGICHTNPGSKYQFLTSPIIDANGEPMQLAVQFRAVAWAFGPCIAAFQYLRPVISIDACFLSGRYEGRLLIACGYDAENQLLPIAFAIVQKEDKEKWGFFLQWLRNEVLGFNRFVCVISDQHKGIKAALTDEYGWGTELFVHRFCIQHVADNMVQNCGKDKRFGSRYKLGAKKKKPRRLEEMFHEFAMVYLIYNISFNYA